MNRMTRREFVALAATGTAAASVGSRDAVAAGITAQDIVERIRQNVGVEWLPETVDTFKAGNPATVVTGVVTTSLATIEVLRGAVKAGANLIISCEPTFYSRRDTPAPPPARGATSSAPDRVFAAKDDFITNNGLVVWRFSDHWRARKPDPFARGLIDALGWSNAPVADDPARVSIPALTLDALASRVKARLNATGGIRVVGNPQTRVRTIGVLPGTTPIQASLRTVPQVDAVIAGEVREWESVEYARDTVTAGGKKGLILVGRILSEEPGMNVCARWLRTIIPEIPTKWLRAGDPYWRPL